jgi:hypothetical protein
MAGWEIPERRGRLMRKTIELNRWFSIAMFESEGNRSLSMADAGAANNRVPPKVYHDFPVYKWLLLEKKPSHFQTHTHTSSLYPHYCWYSSPCLLAEYPQFQKYLNMISSRSHIRIISHQILYILLITYATLYIYVEYYIHIYLDYSKKHH